jgi:hypothetical protein
LQKVGPVIPLNPAGLYADAGSPDGSILALGQFDGTVNVYRHENGHPQVFHMNGPIDQLAASSQGALAVGVLGEPARLYQLSTGQPTATIGQASALAFSTSGKALVVGTPSGKLALVATRTGSPIGPQFPQIPVGVLGAQWSHSYIGTMDNAGRIRLYDPSTGLQIGDEFAGIVDNTGAWSLNPSGSLLALETTDGIDLWDLNPDHWQSAACQLAGRNLSAQEWKTYLGNTGPYRRTCSQWPAGAGV